MFRRSPLGLAVVLTTAFATPAVAQEYKAEVTVNFGWVFSDGVTGKNVAGGDGNIYNEITPKDAGSFHLTFGFLPSENLEAGFLYGRQTSELQARGTATTKLDDMAVVNYHGYFAYNFGDFDQMVRLYLMFGLGATRYDGVSFTTAEGDERNVPGQTRFSTTMGGGLKVYPSPNVGVKLGVRWTPTYIKSDAAGWWCDPWWGCYVVGDSQYSNQFELSGGIAFRF